MDFINNNKYYIIGTIVLIIGIILIAYFSSKKKSCPSDCSSSGTCDTKTGTCECNPNFTGDGCEACVSGYSGSDCSNKQCTLSSDCDANSICNLTSKSCYACPTGTHKDNLSNTCIKDTTACPGDCSGVNGTCKINKDNTTYSCVCNGGWTGNDCAKCTLSGKTGAGYHPGPAGSCSCEGNYTGTDCSVRSGCDPSKCSLPSCIVNSDNTCTCADGFADGSDGSLCSVCADGRGPLFPICSLKLYENSPQGIHIGATDCVYGDNADEECKTLFGIHAGEDGHCSDDSCGLIGKWRWYCDLNKFWAPPNFNIEDATPCYQQTGSYIAPGVQTIPN